MIYITRGMSKDVKSSISLIPKGKPNSAKNLEIQHCSSEECPEWLQQRPVLQKFSNFEKEKKAHFAVVKSQGMKRKRERSCDPQRRINE